MGYLNSYSDLPQHIHGYLTYPIRLLSTNTDSSGRSHGIQNTDGILYLRIAVNSMAPYGVIKLKSKERQH